MVIKNKIIGYGIVLCLLCGLLSAQSVLFDDLSHVHDPESWGDQLDTLSAYGMEVHFTSDEGWSNIIDMEMLWIQSPHYDSIYSDDEIRLFQEYSRNGGKILIGVAMDNEPGLMQPILQLLNNQGWHTTLDLFNIPDYHTFGEFLRGTVGSLFVEIPPITNDVNTARFFAPSGISCGNNAFPFAFAQNYYDRPVAAISFPFLDEGNCSSYVILVSGNHEWENGEIEEVAWRNHRWRVSESEDNSTDTYIFARNILLTLAGVEGYEFDPCAFADSMLVPEPSTFCSAAPNPFTPNGDGIHDEAKFEFPGLGEVPGTIKIFTLGNLRVRTIEVPTGSGAKEAAKWDGRDDSGAPMRQGIYLYTIRAEGRIKCDGTITLAR